MIMETRTCKYCGKNLKNIRNTFCNSSCAAKYNNTHRGVVWTEEKKKEQSSRMMKLLGASEEQIKEHIDKKYNSEKVEKIRVPLILHDRSYKFNSKIKGNIGEAKFLFECVRLSIPVYLQFGDNESADYIILINNKPVKIQVKSSTDFKNSVIQFSLNRSTKHKGKNYNSIYSKEEVDLFACYDIQNDFLFICKNDERSFISFNYNEENPYKTSNKVSDYLFNEENIKRLLEL